ncbi:aminoglycoside phosphotransferase [Oerskovia flava]|uniref:aminoglycoside phosphotransferase n=1 Tax=Oerskovia flava TaxID=2986422 RepID=UPI00223FF6F9|nr:aminoglycoside phosphotransferase [Oerskovia sp. JB1-3-2]
MPTTGPSDVRVDARRPARRTEVPDAELLELLDAWMPARRWYPVKGVVVRHVPWVSYELSVPSTTAATWPGVRVVVHLLRLVGDGVDLVVQVPLVLVPESTPPLVGGAPGMPGAPAATLLGYVSGDERTDDVVAVHDGAAHPACWAALLEHAAWESEAPASLDLAGARALAVEQSNSSVVLPHTAGGTMMKVLRALAIGPNPDVTIPRALTATGWKGVPAPVATLTVSWEPGDVPASSTTLADDRTADLMILSELVDGARDGFELACAYAGRDTSFAELAADLGRVVADMHAALRAAFPVGPPVDVEWLVDDLRRRAREATERSVPLGRRATEIDVFWDRTASRLRGASDVPRLQTVHGDLHLGQVLHARRFGWKVLDFEGEPLRPVAERTRPDIALRDVAGIVRSFDYAAAVGHARRPTWAVQARTAFLDAYEQADRARATGPQHEVAATITRALVLDKALYEVVYESRNRPSWEPIPLAAVDRIVHDG